MREYYVSLIYCVSTHIDHYNSLNNYIDIIFVEKAVNEIMLPSVTINGDASINGELILTNSNNTLNYTIIDPDKEFIGVNTDIREIFYTYKFNPDTKSNIIRNNMIVKNDKYPVAVFERVWETDYSSYIAKINPVYIDNIFKSYSALTVKRTSDLYTFTESFTHATESNVKYGVDIAFEMQNVWLESQEIGHIGFVIESLNTSSITDDSIIKAGFQITATIINSIDSVEEKELLYVSNNGDLHVNSIILPQKTNDNLPENPSKGQMIYATVNDIDYLYVCTSVIPVITWKRIELSDI